MISASAPRAAPGPRGMPFLGSLNDFRKDIIQALMGGWLAYGDVVKFRMGPMPVYLLAHPDHVDHVLHENHRNYRHPPFEIDRLKPTFGEGLVTSQGDFWKRQRRLAQPAFHRQKIAAFATMMTSSVTEMLDEWKPYAERQQTLDMRHEMMRLSLRILAKALFSTDWKGQAELLGNAVSVANEYTNGRLLSPVALPLSVKTPATRRFLEAKATLDNTIYQLIAEARRSQADTGDLLSTLLQARDEETGEGMSDLQLHDELITLFIAGHETVSNGLAWTWYLLSKNPEPARRMRAEVDTELGGRIPTVDDLPRLRYTSMVGDEGLRLYPPIWLIPRTPVQDDVVGGYRIPAGAMVFLVPYITHRHPDYWDNPEGFDPERFLPERSAGRPRYAYYPFGGGPRQCIGNSFALLEIPLTLAMVSQRYELDLVPGHPIAPLAAISLRARHGIMVKLKDRQRNESLQPDAAPPKPREAAISAD